MSANCQLGTIAGLKTAKLEALAGTTGRVNSPTATHLFNHLPLVGTAMVMTLIFELLLFYSASLSIARIDHPFASLSALWPWAMVWTSLHIYAPLYWRLLGFVEHSGVVIQIGQAIRLKLRKSRVPERQAWVVKFKFDRWRRRQANWRSTI